VLLGLLPGKAAWMPITLVPRRSCQVAISMPVGVYSWLSVVTGVGYGKLLLKHWPDEVPEDGKESLLFLFFWWSTVCLSVDGGLGSCRVLISSSFSRQFTCASVGKFHVTLGNQYDMFIIFINNNLHTNNTQNNTITKFGRVRAVPRLHFIGPMKCLRKI
jgi:hypothetical protein